MDHREEEHENIDQNVIEEDDEDNHNNIEEDLKENNNSEYPIDEGEHIDNSNQVITEGDQEVVEEQEE